jgi:hypothetical protein
VNEIVGWRLPALPVQQYVLNVLRVLARRPLHMPLVCGAAAREGQRRVRQGWGGLLGHGRASQWRQRWWRHTDNRSCPLKSAAPPNHRGAPVSIFCSRLAPPPRATWRCSVSMRSKNQNITASGPPPAERSEVRTAMLAPRR